MVDIRSEIVNEYVEEPDQQLGKGRLPRAGLSHHRDTRPDRNVHRDVTKDLGAVGIGEPDMMEVGAEATRAEMVGVLWIGHLHRAVQCTEQATKAGCRALGELQSLDHDLKRLDEEVGQKEKRDQCPGGHPL